MITQKPWVAVEAIQYYQELLQIICDFWLLQDKLDALPQEACNRGPVIQCLNVHTIIQTKSYRYLRREQSAKVSFLALVNALEGLKEFQFPVLEYLVLALASKGTWENFRWSFFVLKFNYNWCSWKCYKDCCRFSQNLDCWWLVPNLLTPLKINLILWIFLFFQ